MRSSSIPQRPRIFAKFTSPQRSCSPAVVEPHINTQQHSSVRTVFSGLMDAASRILVNPLQYSSEKQKQEQPAQAGLNMIKKSDAVALAPQPRPSQSFHAENASANKKNVPTATNNTEISEFNMKDREDSWRMSLNDIKKFLNESGILSRGDNKLERAPFPASETYLNVKAIQGPVPIKLVPESPANKFDLLDSFRGSIDEIAKKSGRVLQSVSSNCSRGVENKFAVESKALGFQTSMTASKAARVENAEIMNSFRGKLRSEAKTSEKNFEEENFDPVVRKLMLEETGGIRKRLANAETHGNGKALGKNQDLPLQQSFLNEKRLKTKNKYDELVKNCIMRTEEALKMLTADETKKEQQQQRRLREKQISDATGLTFSLGLAKEESIETKYAARGHSYKTSPNKKSLEEASALRDEQGSRKGSETNSKRTGYHHQRTSSMGNITQCPALSMDSSSKSKIDEIFNCAMKRSQSILSRLQGGAPEGGLRGQFQVSASSYRPPLSGAKLNVSPLRQRNSEIIKELTNSPLRHSPTRESTPSKNPAGAHNKKSPSDKRKSPSASPLLGGKGSRCGSGVLVRYDGDKNGQVREGRGRAVYSTGEVYEGFWKNDKREGFGQLKNRAGQEVFLGDWENDVFNGQGVERNEFCKATDALDYRNLSNAQEVYERYEGEFREGRKDGIGTLYFSNGEKYVGKISNGVVHGEGTFHSLEAGVVMGFWVQGKLTRIL